MKNGLPCGRKPSFPSQLASLTTPNPTHSPRQGIRRREWPGVQLVPIFLTRLQDHAQTRPRSQPSPTLSRRFPSHLPSGLGVILDIF